MVKLTGVLHKIGETDLKSEKFQIREFVITDNSFTKPQHITMQFVQEKCDVLDSYEIGEHVQVEYELRGRLWEGKYYNTIQALNLKKVSKV